MKKKAIIIGAGPAGLTAAVELQRKNLATPILFEVDVQVGGIAKTYNYKGNRMDIGGHRFFSKSERVVRWWLEYLPLEQTGLNPDGAAQKWIDDAAESGKSMVNPALTDRVMLIRNRVSRIFYIRKFFPYPIAINKETIGNLGLVRIIKSAFSYLYARLFPIKEEKSLEDFFINRFGRELYKTFFKAYTEKVWGVPCNQINAGWGAQRIKGLNIWKALIHAFKESEKTDNLLQKKVETSLIERFLYPKLGPGQLWEIVAEKVLDNGGSVNLSHTVTAIHCKNNQVVSVQYTNAKGEEQEVEGDYFFSTMPLKELINCMRPLPPPHIVQIASGLMYRDFITVGLLVKKIRLGGEEVLKDNWIYIQEPDVKIGRLQVFNNWSPYLVANPDTVWLGLEYFCQQGDELWQMDDARFIQFAIGEMVKMGFFYGEDFMDGCVLRVPNTYPAYFGTYDRFPELVDYLNTIENLFCIGRNGMHRYNNQDHSMLTAMAAVECIEKGQLQQKEHIWEINTEQAYSEEKGS